MPVEIDSQSFGSLTHVTYRHRSFIVRLLRGHDVPTRVWWATTKGQKEVADEVSQADKVAIRQRAHPSENIDINDLPVTTSHITIPTDNGRVVWFDETDDRWTTHDRAPYTVMCVGAAPRPLVALRPRHVTEQTAALVQDAILSEEKE